jgi:hypothetical protein
MELLRGYVRDYLKGYLGAYLPMDYLTYIGVT